MQGRLPLSEPPTTCETRLSGGRVALHFRGEREGKEGRGKGKGRGTNGLGGKKEEGRVKVGKEGKGKGGGGKGKRREMGEEKTERGKEYGIRRRKTRKEMEREGRSQKREWNR